uniref:TRP C-terminal domain-containing protein n=1 Tax=Globisporangium ultimum (strain ATCC 200006 / CBS 805.95 / DAOM BR144) TaxID=431595 RepID=K3WQ76_GLOUD
MLNPVKTAVKCCGCVVLSQLIGVLVSLGVLAAFVLVFYLYAVPWGEDRIRDALHLGSDVDIGSLNASVIAANNCSGCVFGVNTDWPTNTTGALHFLDTSAGPTASAVIATSLAAGAAAGVGSMLWASFFPSAASVMSFSSGFYEMTHIVEQAQFIGMISQLQIDGAPVFLHQFSREMAWTNFNVPKSITDRFSSTSRRRLESSSLLSTTASGETGPKRYADLIGVSPERLFFYTLLSFAIVVGAIHVLYIIGVAIFSMLSKKESFGQVAAKLYQKVIWACILALLLAQYIFSMAGSYYIYQNADSSDRDSYFVWGTIGLIVVVGFALVFGVLIISANRKELEDIGTFEHDQRPFSAKYGPYYDEYNFDNRFFFVPRILLAVSTGAVVGTIQNGTTQLLCILGITMLYLMLLLVREPNLLRFLYYIGITSVFMKVVLVCMMLMLVQDDYFPQSVRDNVAYGIIGVNIFIFFLLFLRQAYTIIHKLVRGCKNKKNTRDRATSDEVINLENGNGLPRNPPPYSRLESTASYNNKAAQTPVQNTNGAMAANTGFTNNQTNQQFGRGNA